MRLSNLGRRGSFSCPINSGRILYSLSSFETRSIAFLPRSAGPASAAHCVGAKPKEEADHVDQCEQGLEVEAAKGPAHRVCVRKTRLDSPGLTRRDVVIRSGRS